LALALGILSLPIALSVQAALTNQSKLVLNGIDGVRVGMTVSEASRAVEMQAEDKPNPDCYYVKPKNSPQVIGFMVTNGRIARVDVWQNRQITTLSGAKIGDSEARIRSLYPGRIQTTPHKYVPNGHYLTFVPKDASGRNYRVVFETDGQKVTSFRAGKLPEVQYVEGCS
jgi:hypothetical protein